MTDREKVIKGLEGVLEWLSEGEDRKCVAAYRAVEDALELLKEPEPVSPFCDKGLCVCGNCGNWVYKSDRYCSKCGKAVKWE